MAHLEVLARQPRPPGSEAAASAQDYCAAQLTPLGFTVTKRPFEYSELPGRFGAPIVGVTGAALTIASVVVGARGIAAAIIGAAVTTIVTAALARWLGGKSATRGKALRARATNLEATRGRDPRVWLIAHVDSKSQPVSTAIRTLGVVLLSASIVGLWIRLAVQSTGLWPSFPAVLTTFAVLGGVILGCAVVGSRSDGAADNASGMATVLEAVENIPRAKSLGVLITDGEELTLAGARAWVEGRAHGVAINCDTIDDEGRLVVMRYAGSSDLSQRLLIAARAEDPQATSIRPLPGVLTDSVAFAAVGWQTVTLGRGTLRTLNRIHTVRDNLHHLRGTGVSIAARTLARLVEELT